MARLPVHFIRRQLVVPFFSLERRIDRDSGTNGT